MHLLHLFCLKTGCTSPLFKNLDQKRTSQVQAIKRQRQSHCTTGLLAIFDAIFAPEIGDGGVRRYSDFFDLRRRKSKVGDGGVLRSSGSEDRKWGVLRYSETEDRRKLPPIYNCLCRRSKNPPIFNLRFSTPKIEEPRPYLRFSAPNDGSKIGRR